MAATDLGPWSPLQVDQVTELFSEAPFRWWFTGGHALEMHLGDSWRDHDDIDVSVCRSDAASLFQVLKNYDVHLAAGGVLTPWHGTPLDAAQSQNNLWCRHSAVEPWCLDITISDGVDDRWIYRRDPAVSVPWHHAVLSTSDGKPYLAPTLQLLFKSAGPRDKDTRDAQMVVPRLDTAAQIELAGWLPAEHPWHVITGAALAMTAAGTGAIDESPVLMAAGRSSQAWRLRHGDAEETSSVVRVPIPNSGRLLSYRSEAQIGTVLANQGLPVAPWRIVTVGDLLCSVGPELPGTPVEYGDQWTTQFAAELATTLHSLHQLPCTGYGPLRNIAAELRGSSTSRRQGVVDRWFHAAIWPFDDSLFSAHPVHGIDADLGARAQQLADPILAAESGPIGVVHSDLHREHLLRGRGGELSGLLDFGDAFVGALAWDFALLLWYYGPINTALVASSYPRGGDLIAPHGSDLIATAEVLAVAVGLYKLARQPDKIDILDRLRQVVNSAP